MSEKYRGHLLMSSIAPISRSLGEPSTTSTSRSGKPRPFLRVDDACNLSFELGETVFCRWEGEWTYGIITDIGTLKSPYYGSRPFMHYTVLLRDPCNRGSGNRPIFVTRIMSPSTGCLKPFNSYMEQLLEMERKLVAFDEDWMVDLLKACSPKLTAQITSKWVTHTKLKF